MGAYRHGLFYYSQWHLRYSKTCFEDVLDDRNKQKCPIKIVQFLPTNSFVFRPVLRCTLHNNADVGIGLAAPGTSNKTGAVLRNKVLTLTKTLPAKGDVVFTCAYPNTVNVVEDPQRIYFNPRYYSGHIVEYFPNGRDRICLPSPCYQTSIVIHGGASGGPVFNTNGKVIGINSTGFASLHDISFVSRINEILFLNATDVKLSESSEMKDVTVAELAKLGHVKLA